MEYPASTSVTPSLRHIATKAAKEAVGMALAEMQHGLARGHISTFYVEAIIGADNKPSQRVAEQALSATPVAVTDQVSGLPVFQYVRKIEPSDR
jgi:hypothetical protein